MAGALITDNIHGMQNMTNILQSIVRRQLPSPPLYSLLFKSSNYIT